MTAAFQLEGQDFVALNGGPHYKFTPAISFVVNCETQQEVDELWEKLSAGGRKDRCGWLQDKFGVSWQIVPTILSKLLQDKDPEKAKRVKLRVNGQETIQNDDAGKQRKPSAIAAKPWAETMQALRRSRNAPIIWGCRVPSFLCREQRRLRPFSCACRVF